MEIRQCCNKVSNHWLHAMTGDNFILKETDSIMRKGKAFNDSERLPLRGKEKNPILSKLGEESPSLYNFLSMFFAGADGFGTYIGISEWLYLLCSSIFSFSVDTCSTEPGKQNEIHAF